MSELENFPANEKINWSALARQYNIPGKNAGQVLKEMANKHGIDTTRLDQRSNATRIRRHKFRLPGQEISMPCLPTVHTVIEEQRQLILSGELSIGEPCAPFSLTKSMITKDGKVEFRSVEICGRKIPLNELRARLLKKQERFMYLYSNERISNMSAQDIHHFMAMMHYQPIPNSSIEELRHTVKMLQRNRTLAMWHDSTILQTGYILFAVWVIYDPAVFYTQEYWKSLNPQKGNVHIQSLVEEPMIYMIAPSSSSHTDQLALVGDRTECLSELSKPVITSDGTTEINDCLRFFCGDKPAQQFERGTQIGGTYKCGGCGCKDVLMIDIAHAFHNSWRSLLTYRWSF